MVNECNLASTLLSLSLSPSSGRRMGKGEGRVLWFHTSLTSFLQKRPLVSLPPKKKSSASNMHNALLVGRMPMLTTPPRSSSRPENQQQARSSSSSLQSSSGVSSSTGGPQHLQRVAGSDSRGALGRSSTLSVSASAIANSSKHEQNVQALLAAAAPALAVDSVIGDVARLRSRLQTAIASFNNSTAEIRALAPKTIGKSAQQTQQPQQPQSAAPAETTQGDASDQTDGAKDKTDGGIDVDSNDAKPCACTQLKIGSAGSAGSDDNADGECSAQCQLCGETVDIIARLLGEKADLQDALDEVNSLLKDVQRAKSASDNSVSHMESRVIELERNIDERIDQITSLEKALRKANDALMDESEKLKQVQELNKRLNGEIEDLTRGLVEEAQEMVRVERIQYADLKQISDQQLRQIEELKNGLSSEQLQSKELKVKIEQMAGELDLKTDELTAARTLIATLQQQLDEAIVSNSERNNSSGGSDKQDTPASTTAANGESTGDGANEPSSRSSGDGDGDGDRTPAPSLSASASTDGKLASKKKSYSAFDVPKVPSAALRRGLSRSNVRTGASGSLGGAPLTCQDVTLLDEFTEFVKSAPATRINKLYTHAFMKHCITEDIEPCLRFGPNPRLSARNVIESISNFSLRIEEIPDDQLQRDSQQQQQQAQQQSQQQQQQQSLTRSSSSASVASGRDSIDGLPSLSGISRLTSNDATAAAQRMLSPVQSLLWDRFGNAPISRNACQACGRDWFCRFRFRLGLSMDEEWCRLDSFCRDKLVTVYEFYSFIRNLRLGHYKDMSIPELYAECTRLRLRMFHVRSGTLLLATQETSDWSKPQGPIDQPVSSTTAAAAQSLAVPPLPRTSSLDPRLAEAAKLAVPSLPSIGGASSNKSAFSPSSSLSSSTATANGQPGRVLTREQSLAERLSKIAHSVSSTSIAMNRTSSPNPLLHSSSAAAAVTSSSSSTPPPQASNTPPPPQSTTQQ